MHKCIMLGLVVHIFNEGMYEGILYVLLHTIILEGVLVCVLPLACLIMGTIFWQT